MRQLIKKVVVLWRFLALSIRLFSLRAFVLLSALALFLMPGSLAFWTVLDDALIAPASQLAGFEKGPTDFAIITVPEDDIENWQRDLYAAESLSSLLSNILHASDALVGIVLPGLPNSYLSDIESALLNDSKTAKKNKSKKDYVQAAEKKRYRKNLLDDKRVVLGHVSESAGLFVRRKSNFYVEMLGDANNNGYRAKAARTVLKWFENCFFCQGYSATRSVTPADSSVSAATYPLTKKLLGRTPFYLRDKKDELAPEDFMSHFLDASMATDLIADSPFGANWVIAANNMNSSLSARFIDYDFTEALTVNAFPKYVLIGSSANSEQLHQVLNILHSFHYQNLFYEPWWHEFTLRLAGLFLAIYLCFIHVRLKSRAKRWFFSIFIFALLVVAVLLVAWLYQLWVFVSVILIWYFFALMLLSWWRIQNRYERQAEKALNGAVADAAISLESHQCIEEAMAIAMHQPDQSAVVSRLCHLSDKLATEHGRHELSVQLLRQAQEVDKARKNRIGGFGRIEKQIQKLKSGSTQVLGATSPHNVHSHIPIPEQLGRYKIQREIGRGSVGVVYQAFDPAISRKVAVKTLDTRHLSAEQVKGLKTRFFREAEAAGRLSHPHIVSVFDVGESHELAYIAMDFVDGKALNECVEQNALLPASIVYRIIHDVAMALDYAHTNHIVHRDIKPGNIMYCESPYLTKVADFGIARLLDNSRTTTGEILGSPLYMSPEQLKGARVGPTADIFSLGVTFYQLLTGKLPFNAESLAGLTYEIIHTKHPSVRSINRNLPASAARIINQCLQKKPHERYESASELAAVLKKAIRRDFPVEANKFGML